MPFIFRAGCSGCLLPALIFFNTFFGWIFFKPAKLWLSIEAILILLAILQLHSSYRFILSNFNKKSRRDAIDVEGKVVDK